MEWTIYKGFDDWFYVRHVTDDSECKTFTVPNGTGRNGSCAKCNKQIPFPVLFQLKLLRGE